jgi:hypothetical protein
VILHNLDSDLNFSWYIFSAGEERHWHISYWYRVRSAVQSVSVVWLGTAGIWHAFFMVVLSPSVQISSGCSVGV